MSHLRTRANPNCRKTTSKKHQQKTSTPSAQQQAQQRPQETQRKHIEGTNGRSVTILYEGSGDYEGHSSPKRQPCSFEDLTSDQVDIILNQVESAQKNLISTMTMTDDIVIVQSEEDIAALCKDCNGTHHSQTAVQTQLKDIKSSQKALEKKVDNLLEILTTFVKKQETCVTFDLNTSSFVIEPESTPPSKVTKALNNIFTTSVGTTAQDTSGAKIPFNTSILEDTCDTSTTSNNLTTGGTSTTGNIRTTLRASTTSKNSIDSTIGNNSTSNTQTTSKTLTGSTASTGNLTCRPLSTDNNSMRSTSSTGNNLTGSTPSTGNLTGRTLSTSNNSMGNTLSTANNSTSSTPSTANNSMGSTPSTANNSMGSTPSTGNSTGSTSSTGNNSTGSIPSTVNSTGHTVSTDNSMGSTPSTVSTSSTGNNSTGSTPSTVNSTSSTPSSGNNSTDSILMSGKIMTSNTPLTGNNSLGNTLIGSTPSMFITSSMVGTSTPVTSFETTSREEPRVFLIDASNDELPPPVCETIAELVLVEENEENVAPSLENRIANQMKKPRLQRMKRFPSPCKANAITTYIRSSEDVEPGNYEILVCPDVLMEIKDRSCSDGNFLLNTARRIFKEEELEGKNYSGRKGRPGISPRRKHALQHAFAEHCSSNIDDFKRAVIALNSGIRGLAFK